MKLNHKKAHGHDMINAKFLKISVDIILQTLLNIINKCIIQGTFPNFLKKAVVSPVYKKINSPFNKENYRPLSLLTTFSKVFEKAIELQLSPFLEEKFSKFLCTYRKQFSSQHALFRLIEDRKTELERNKHYGAVHKDLSKAFDCLPINLLLAKLHAYSVDRNSLLLIQNYLSNRKQRVKVKGHYSSWVNIGQGVPQGSIVGPLLFNISLNDIFYNLTEGNFADDNTISVTATNTDELMQLVKINIKQCLD